MKTVQVNASKNYSVLIGSGLLSEISMHLGQFDSCKKVAIISDTNVWPSYGEGLEENIQAAGYNCCHYVFPAGEVSKNGQTYLTILNFLAEAQITRSDVIIALGGGVVGDIAGFAAATYLRGISFIQIPTSLLAMVDSSVGGKTAIDLPAGKNLAGAFYQPSLVLCDVSTLNTLPENIFRDGCAEIIKYGVLYDRKLMDYLTEVGLDFDREAVIHRCVELKSNVVKQDEFDRGGRQRLNLGHTIGHGIEASSNFKISHGQAVAIGMAIVAKAGYNTGICEKEAYEKILSTLSAFSLPTTTSVSAETLLTYALSDKKRNMDIVNLIIPEKIGFCQIHPIPISKLKSFIEAGL